MAAEGLLNQDLVFSCSLTHSHVSSSGDVTVRVGAGDDANRVHGQVEGAVLAGEGRGHEVLQEAQRVGREDGGGGVFHSRECKQEQGWSAVPVLYAAATWLKI